MEVLMNISQVATYLGMGAENVRYLARNHRIPAAKVGRVWRFSKPAIDDFINKQFNEQPVDHGTRVDQPQG